MGHGKEHANTNGKHSNKQVDARVIKLAEILDIPIQTDDLLFKIFREIFLSSLRGNGIKTSDFCSKENVSQSSAVYYFNILIDRGIIERRGWVYTLRGGDIEHFADLFESEMYHRMRLMKKLIDDLDDKL